MDIKIFVATKAFIVKEGKILVVRESGKYADGTNEGSYDVVGGRLTPGERFDEALLREVKEETGLEVKIDEPFFVNEWRPEVRGEQWQIVGMFFKCDYVAGEVDLSEDHDDYKWIAPSEFENAGIITNLREAFNAYMRRYGGS